MDRREALKKLAVGGAAVVGASTIMTSPAFAATPVPATPSITVTGSTTDKKAYTINVSGISATCSASQPTAKFSSTLSYSTSNKDTGSAGPFTTSSFSVPDKSSADLKAKDTVTSTLSTTYTCGTDVAHAICVKWTETSQVTTAGDGKGKAPVFSDGAVTKSGTC